MPLLPTRTSLLRKTHAGTDSNNTVGVGIGTLFSANHQSLIDQNPEQPTAKLAFIFKPQKVTRSSAPTTSYGFFRAFRTAKDTTCNEVKQPVAAPEPGIKHQLLLIEPRSFREVRSRVIIEMDINFTVGHAA